MLEKTIFTTIFYKGKHKIIAIHKCNISKKRPYKENVVFNNFSTDRQNKLFASTIIVAPFFLKNAWQWKILRKL